LQFLVHLRGVTNGAKIRGLLVPVRKHVCEPGGFPRLPLSLPVRVLPDDADVDTLEILAYVHQVSHSAIMRETLLEIAYTSESFKS
jgi:hypothetical protein